MEQKDVVDLLNAIKNIDISVWIGGGWGISALVGFQSRPHNDIDVYIEKKNAIKFIEMLILKGYSETKTDFTNEVHTVWQDSEKRTVDLHLFEFGEPGTIYYDGEPYPSNVLDGAGAIGGHDVLCFTAEAQLLFHQGYEHSEKDIHDVMLLCKTFGFDIPAEYK